MGDESEISETVIELFNKNIQGITGHREFDLWMAGGEPHDKIRQERLEAVPRKPIPSSPVEVEETSLIRSRA